LFDVYKGPGNYSFPARAGHKIPRVDPSAAVSAMAQATESLGFGITFSTVSEHPYHFARRLATLDHFSGGRVGWNVVSSYLDITGRQLLNGEPLPEHDKRYQRTSEYLDVVYKLLLSSWRDDAVVHDRKNSTFVDPGRLRTINHEGDFFKVEGRRRANAAEISCDHPSRHFFKG
jgi:alkanesulfonate monooxygenase SsuD/methylene tetrahydromethanopterin reductase-like flavin-dependent oxidoreductase (luciferase family)